MIGPLFRRLTEFVNRTNMAPCLTFDSEPIMLREISTFILASFTALTLGSRVANAVDLTPDLQKKICADTATETVPDTSTAWGCYDPLPGHPTEAERRSFADRISSAALDGEREFGPPAPALVAMAMVESGSGFTRMPICSNNLFGFKWVSAKAAGGRPAFSLQCQPQWDKNNRYVQFKTPEELVVFVASKLATISAYRDHTAQFRRDIAEGVDRRAAIRRWLEGVAPSYTFDPKNYVPSVLRTINDPAAPSDTLNPKNTLYHLDPNAPKSSVAPPTTGNALKAQKALPIADATTEALKKSVIATLTDRFANGDRYVIGKETAQLPHQYCRQINAGDQLLTNPNVAPYARLVANPSATLLECDYQLSAHDSRRGWVIVVAATPQNLADRMVGACLEVAPTATQECVRRLMNNNDYDAPYGSNDLIYPITGFVSEPCSDRGPEGLIGFRHGVTTRYSKGSDLSQAEQYCMVDDTPIPWQKDVGLNSGSYRVAFVGRIAALHRDSKEAQAEKRFGPNATKGQNPDDFQSYVRDNEIRAVETGYDRMMVIKAAQKMKLPVPKAN